MMFGETPAAVIVLLALAVVFTALALRDYLLKKGEFTPARKTWLRIAFIFSAISVALFVWHSFF